MIQIVKDMKMPEECHECPFQIKFKNGVVDDWYMRRCVIEDRITEYPRLNWCPIREQEAVMVYRVRAEHGGMCAEIAAKILTLMTHIADIAGRR